LGSRESGGSPPDFLARKGALILPRRVLHYSCTYPGLVNYCWATSLGRGEKKPESIIERGSQGMVIRASSSQGEFNSSLVSPFLGICQRFLYSKSRVVREGSFGKEENS